MKKKFSVLGIFLASSFGCSSSLEDAAVYAVEMSLIDPDSMQVRSVESVEVCGHDYVEVVYNAKNRGGGYNGFTSEYYNPRNTKLTEYDISQHCDLFLHRAGDMPDEEFRAGKEARDNELWERVGRRNNYK
jgi:hypothetical protein